MTITSNSFPIEGDYQILWSQNPKFDDANTIILKEGISPKGSLTVISSFSIPEAPAGLHYVGFVRLGRDDITIFSFTVMPRMRIPPNSRSPGNTISVNGTGFPSNNTASLTFDDSSVDINATTKNNGSFTAGEHQISATSAKLTAVVAPATLLVVPAITVTPQFPQAGSQVTISGSGFAAKVDVSIKYNDLVMTNSPSTNDAGSFTYSFTLPQSANAGSKFVATDSAGNTATFSGGVNIPFSSPPSSPPSSPSQPPQTPTTPQTPIPPAITPLPKPSTLEPKDQSFGLFGAQQVKFVWTQASSFAPNTITYILEVANNFKFDPVKSGMRASNIAQTNFTLNLKPGTYYWRVKAVDTSGRESEWSTSRFGFKVGAVPAWIFVGGGIIYVVMLYLLIRALLRRRNRYPYYY
jgi:hypothetical protein